MRSVCISAERGVAKRSVPEAEAIQGHGLQGDAHAGPWRRQVSLLAVESVRKLRGASADVGPGDSAENLTVEGLDLPSLPIGTKLRVGDAVLLEVTQIGKEDHVPSQMPEQLRESVLPQEGVFARVLEGGAIRPGDEIVVIEEGDESSDPDSQ